MEAKIGSGAPLLEVRNLSVGFGDKAIVRDVNFVQHAGEFVALVGRSGSGKTTLLHTLAGLIPSKSGVIRLRNQEMPTCNSVAWTEARRGIVCLAFQQGWMLDDDSALESAMVPSLLAGATVSDARERAESLLNAVGLIDYAGQPIAKLSGGQRQRVAVARALVLDPPLVLADEPTGNLDAESASGLLDLFDRLRSVRRIAFLVTTHDPLVLERADRVVELHEGSLRPLQADLHAPQGA